MAFVQQHRRRYHRSQPSVSSDSEDMSSIYHKSGSVTQTNLVLSPGVTQPSSSYPSDSDTDWHVISSALPSASSSQPSPSHSNLSPALPPSETESFSSFRPSDTESFSDVDMHGDATVDPSHGQSSLFFSALPAHDGTGLFVINSDNRSAHDANTPAAFARVVQHMLGEQEWRTTTDEQEFEPDTTSMPNILLPHGGICPPSFAHSIHMSSASSLSQPVSPTSASPHPPWAEFTTHDLDMVLSAEAMEPVDAQLSEASVTTTSTTSTNRAYTRDNVKFTRRRYRNLDSIPTHHPAIPGTTTSFAILSIVWNHICRLTNHLIENDTSTSDTLSSLFSEAVVEGLLPLGSHLHMDLGASLRPLYSRRRLEGIPEIQ
ncbi:uncharacterized protein BYT42DRAFT_6787 [Radiomyces spectabilis]|uniref:uncharacterized protein n=1 Tax=Radiomyces spectabilis TaxID=64574 RepID=UPI00221E8C58|nr:uncharacterized protein BYT42DRAFT_6787 [Radiomyces spectabilis]KAI8393451.1 hypothetical protein BYT42DRAFT_6787 [Radiomyces spectabilis]